MYNIRTILRLIRSSKNRSFSDCASHQRTVAEPLEHRSLLRVHGAEAHTFLQGLITNDIAHLESGSSALYAMFLNTRGRVLYDVLIYKSNEPHTFLVECDSSAVVSLERHVKLFRLRKKIDVGVDKDLKVWAVYDPEAGNDRTSSLLDHVKDNLLGKIIPCDKLSDIKGIKRESLTFGSLLSQTNVMMYQDPRVNDLGMRVLCTNSENINELIQVKKGTAYRALRYRLGVGEGVEDLPPDNCFPLEANCDYLHGVSFHKGCYIGQELTARTHHTGVVRKRLMPLFFEAPVTSTSTEKLSILTDKEKPVGKVRGVDGTIGLGLLRLSEALSAQQLTLGGTTVRTVKPAWWPKQAPKEVESRDKQ